MGWEKTIIADFGKYRSGLQNAVISPSDKYSSVNGQRQYLYPDHDITQGTISVDHMGVSIPISDIPQGEWVNAFGFKLYQQGEYTNKVAMCRIYGDIITTTPGNIQRYYRLRWAIFDENTHNYTWLGDYYVNIGIGQVGQVQWTNVKCNLVFQVRDERLLDAQGGTQKVLYGGIYCFADESNYGSDITYVGLGMVGIGEKWHLGLYDEINPEGQEFSPEFGPAAEEGGYGPTPSGGSSGGSGGPGPTFDSVSDPWVDTPTKPGATAFGLLNLYKCDQGALSNLGSDLFPEITWPSSAGFSDIVEWLGKTIQAFSDSVWNKGLIDYIISVHLLPIDVPAGALTDIKIGPRTMTGDMGRPITNDIVEFDCGTIHIDEYYTSYIDYMTVCRVYIPFHGMVTIKPEYWQSADLQLKYIWNVLDGSFVAQLFSTISRHQKPCKTMIGQYAGSACVHMPLSGSDYANMFATLAGAAGSAGVAAATGNVALAASSAMNYAGAVGGVGDMAQSNSYNASSAFYGHARPFVVIERPVSHFSVNYNVEQGLPLLVTKTIGQCSGLTICDNPVLNFVCPDDEAKAIINALKEGVIL